MTRPPAIPQRATIVLPSTGEFDSRTYRIASALAARGHTVTVLARLGPGAPVEEAHPAGYRIRRVETGAVDGLPLPSSIRRRARRSPAGPDVADGAGDSHPDGSTGRRALTPAPAGPGADRPAVASPEPASAVPASPAPTSPGAATSAPAGRSRAVLGTAKRLGGAVRRIAAMALVVRSQARASRAIDDGADLYHGMAYMGVPVALSLARRRPRARVVYDARDIYVDAGNLARLPGPVRRVVGSAERRWARRVDRVVTVNQPYAEVMARRWGLPLPVIVLNCSYRYAPARPKRRLFHERLGLPPDRRVVLYQGGFSRDRGIEQLIEAVPRVPNATLVLLGYGPLRATIERAAAMPGMADRVRVLDAVPPTELLDWVAAADVVAMPIQPTTLNHRLTTPNKLLEAMAAGVPVVASDLPGMADIVRAVGCGVLCDPTDPVSVAAAIRDVLDAPDGGAAMAARGLDAAHAEYNWETQMDKLLDLYTQLTGKPW